MRKIIILINICFLITCAEKENYSPNNEATSQFFKPSLKPFYHGVASGDPYNESVVLWTRVTPELRLPKIAVKWEIATDSLFNDIVNKGEVETDSTKDYTVKVIADQLEAGMLYYYRFKALEATSMVGKTKTAAQNTDNVNFAIVSCSNYQFGSFNAYANIAKRDELDAVLHLGDYFYEYGKGVYGDSSSQRFHIPEHELVTLDDYRTRYSQYRLDQDLMAVHAALPFIAIWDDHEIANNAYKTGAQNHQEDEGDFMKRKEAAIKAYYEWMPVRKVNPLYRKFSYGSQTDLFMLDERAEGRTAPVDSVSDPKIDSSAQRMLGEKQLNWLKDELKSSDAKWKVIGNQVIFSYLNWGYETFNINLDSWDGYPYERAELKRFIQSDSIRNVVFVTGDTHSSWAFEVTDKPFTEYDSATSDGAFAVEFGVTSVNSGNANERFPDDSVIMHEKKLVSPNLNPHLRYANLRDHGYMVLSMTDSVASVSWYYVESMKPSNKKEQLGETIKVVPGSNKLIIN